MEAVGLLKSILILLIFIIFILIGIYVWLEYKLRAKETESQKAAEESEKARREDNFRKISRSIK